MTKDIGGIRVNTNFFVWVIALYQRKRTNGRSSSRNFMCRKARCMSAKKAYWGKRNRRSNSTRMFNKQGPVCRQSLRLTFPELAAKTIRRGVVSESLRTKKCGK